MTLKNLLGISVDAVQADKGLVAKLLAAAQRNIADAQLAGLSAENRFDAAYKAIMQVAMVALNANGYLTNMLEATKSVHEKVVYDSDTERGFAGDLEKNTAVKLYAKLPGWFTVPTPLGNYNPDWAVLVNADGTDRLYFVVETKSTLFDDALRDAEVAKIACGREHFATIAEGADAAKFVRATTVDAFSKHW